jgi:hypothetical protein
MPDAAFRDTEVEWQLDAHDLRPVQRWLDAAAASASARLTIGPGRTATQVDVYLDEERRLVRAGYSVRVRRGPRQPGKATLKSPAAGRARPDGLRVRREISEQLEGDTPEAVAAASGPVGERIRALVGGRASCRSSRFGRGARLAARGRRRA